MGDECFTDRQRDITVVKPRHGFIRYGLITIHGRQDLKFSVINHYVCDEMNVCYPRNPISLACQFEDCRP